MDARRPQPSHATVAEGILGSERLRTWLVAAAYTLITVVFTWPVAKGLASDVPSDLGDSLLNMWILSWDAEQLKRLFTGDLAVALTFFDANIFYPAPDALAYSEHLFAQALQIFPIYLATGNPILCYNLLFLSTSVLSGLGTYLLVRELIGDRLVAFAAGLFFGFVLYRIPQASHMQVLSSQWMPFTLYGFTRYLNSGRRRALAGGTLALILQCLSCGYFLIYFSPFAAMYVLWELWRRRRLADRRAWADLLAAAAVTGLAVTPFLIPYARVQATTQLARRLDEVILYSADVFAYLQAFPTQRFWGAFLNPAPRAEGELFLGAIPLLLGGLSLWFASTDARRATSAIGDPRPIATATLATISAVLCLLTVIVLFTRRLRIDVGLFAIQISDLGRVLTWLLAASALWLLISPRARACLRACRTTQWFFLIAVAVAWWLSLGPSPHSLGRPLDMPAPYRLLYALPGADGVRVPARFAMVLALMLAVSAGYALQRLRQRRNGTWITIAAMTLFLVEAAPTTFSINGQGGTQGHPQPEARVYPPGSAPPIYRTLATLDEHIALLELPIGDFNWDVRAVYYAATHWQPLINGYSGFFPIHYGRLISSLVDPARDPDEAWQAVASSGATHVLVHEAAYRDDEVAQISRWLASAGAREIHRQNGDILYDVRP